LRGDDGTMLSKIYIAGMMYAKFLCRSQVIKVLPVSRGSAVVDYPQNEVVINNVSSGFDSHQLDSGNWKQTFLTGNPTRKFPKQVAFGEMGRVVIGGSDHGVVYVFNRKTAETVQILQHGERNMVQTITVSISPSFLGIDI
jgi:hypothetical protein